MESRPQNPEFRINPGNFHPCKELKTYIQTEMNISGCILEELSM